MTCISGNSPENGLFSYSGAIGMPSVRVDDSRRLPD